MYIHSFVYVPTQECTYVSTFVYICTHTRVYIYSFVYVHTHSRRYIHFFHIRMYIYRRYIGLCVHTYVLMHNVHTHMHVHRFVCTYVCTHAQCTYTHACTYVQMLLHTDLRMCILYQVYDLYVRNVAMKLLSDFKQNKYYLVVSKVLLYVQYIACLYVNCGNSVIIRSQVSNNKNQSTDWSRRFIESTYNVARSSDLRSNEKLQVSLIM